MEIVVTDQPDVPETYSGLVNLMDDANNGAVVVGTYLTRLADAIVVGKRQRQARDNLPHYRGLRHRRRRQISNNSHDNA